LFRNSDRVTRGYYYFADEDDYEFLPVPCWYGSVNWITDDIPSDGPPLGEIPPATRFSRTWRNGAPPDLPPERRFLGSAECMEAGDEYPPEVLNQSSYAGVSSLLYTPPVSPLGEGLCLWLKPEDLIYGPEPHSLARWPDSSGLVRDAVARFPEYEPTVAAVGPGYPRKMRTDNFKYLAFPGVIGLTTRYSIYMVGWVRPAELITTQSALALGQEEYPGIPTVVATAQDLTLYVGVTGESLTMESPVDQYGIWCFRREGSRVRIEWVGQQSGDFDGNIDPTVCGRIASVGTGTDTGESEDYLAELLVFDRSLDDERHLAVVEYLSARYY